MSKFLSQMLLLLLINGCGKVKKEESALATSPQATFYCPSGFGYNANSRLCESSSEALGPFTVAMIEKCFDGGDTNKCSANRWELAVARRIRGTGPCPPGATLQSSLCIEGDNAFGPFTKSHVATCSKNGDVLTCQSMRWVRDLALHTYPQEGFTFPLSGPALANYTSDMRSFGACRDNCSRRHAATDLYAKTGSIVHAVGAGTVIDFYEFYLGTYALVIDHGNFIVRYGEIKNDLPKGIQVGAQVRQGQGIGYVGRLTGLKNDMVHFERFSGQRQGPLTEQDAAPYQRRGDLVDPTKDLLSWKYPQ